MSPGDAQPSSGPSSDTKYAAAPTPGETTHSSTGPIETPPPPGGHAPTAAMEAQAAGPGPDDAQPSGSNGAADDLIQLYDDAPPVSSTGKGGEDGGESHQTPGAASRSQEASNDETALDLLTSSVATLKPATPTAQPTTATLYLNVQTSTSYVDPTPPTPLVSPPPSRTPSNAPRHRQHPSTGASSPSPSDAAFDERRYMSDDEQENGSRSEIQSIMEQIGEERGGPGEEEVMSPRLEMASPLLSSPMQHPPRKSSLEPLAPNLAHQLQDMQNLRISSSSPASVRSKPREHDDQGPPVPPKEGKLPDERRGSMDTPLSPSISLHRPPPPDPEPEPAQAFDFHRFLEQLRHKKADPVARYLKSFLSEFGKRQWMVHEQVKIISDFLAFIANKMAVSDVWKEVSDAEFDNAREGMEKLVMNRLFTQTFSPAIPPPQPFPGAMPKKMGSD